MKRWRRAGGASVAGGSGTRRSGLPRTGTLALALYLLAALAAWTGIPGPRGDAITDAAYAAPSPAHWFGTNRLGQDVFARTVAGSGPALLIGAGVTVATALIGAAIGGFAAARGGRIDAVLMGLTGVVDALPVYLLAGSLAYAARGSELVLFAVLILSFWTGTARLVRAEVLRLRSLPFVAAARAAGVSDTQVMRRHLLPHCLPVIVAQGGIVFVAAVKTEAVLAFLGLGSGSGTHWGGMLAQAAQEVGGGHFQNFLAAGCALAGLVLTVNGWSARLLRTMRT